MKWLLRILGLYLAGLTALFMFAAVAGEPTSPAASPGHYPTSALQADWQMTQTMNAQVGPGMQAQMPTYGMLLRSQSSSYTAALDQYAQQIDRMLGRDGVSAAVTP